LAEQHAFVDVEAAFGKTQQGPAGQEEEPDDPHQQEPAAGLLAAGLGISSLIRLGVGRGGVGDQADAATAFMVAKAELGRATPLRLTVR
jgi:hypothetical protein